jgi:hypothetical protein
MSEEPESTVLHHLKALRGDIRRLDGKLTEINNEVRSIRLTVAGHDLRFDSLDERFDLVRQGTISAIGFAADASRSSTATRDQLADLTRRVEKLEQAK